MAVLGVFPQLKLVAVIYKYDLREARIRREFRVGQGRGRGKGREMQGRHS